jgi:hypothetical protein
LGSLTFNLRTDEEEERERRKEDGADWSDFLRRRSARLHKCDDHDHFDECDDNFDDHHFDNDHFHKCDDLDHFDEDKNLAARRAGSSPTSQ